MNQIAISMSQNQCAKSNMQQNILVKCVKCNQEIAQNNIQKHIKSHQKRKRPKAKQKLVEFWGWKHHGASSKQYINKNNKKLNENQDEQKDKEKMPKQKKIYKTKPLHKQIQFLQSHGVQAQGVNVGNHTLRLRKLKAYNQQSSDQKNSGEDQMISQRSQEDKNGQIQISKQVKLQQNIKSQRIQTVQQLKFKLVKQKQKINVLQKQFLQLRRKFKDVQKSLKQKDDQIQQLKKQLNYQKHVQQFAMPVKLQQNMISKIEESPNSKHHFLINSLAYQPISFPGLNSILQPTYCPRQNTFFNPHNQTINQNNFQMREKVSPNDNHLQNQNRNQKQNHFHNENKSNRGGNQLQNFSKKQTVKEQDEQQDIEEQNL